jgi:polar amino acid transport system substrate-binding protein
MKSGENAIGYRGGSFEVLYHCLDNHSFIAPEESTPLIELSGLPIEDFTSLRFPAMPSGEKRYILCSRRVKDAIMEKLNRAIDAYMNKDH